MSWTRRRFLKVAGTGVAVATGACGTTTGTGSDAGDAPDSAASDALDRVAPIDGAPIDTMPPFDAGGMDAFDASMDDAALDALDDVPADTGPYQCGPATDPAAHPELAIGNVPLNAASFPQGVMAGDALPDRAVLWTRYGGMRSLFVYVMELRSDGVVARVAYEAPVTPAGPLGIVHVDVPNLRPGAKYRYGFLERNGTTNVGRSRIGTFRTALDPRDNCTSLTFGGVSCNSGRQAGMMGDNVPALGQAANDDLDFFVHAGDHIYADFYGANGARTLTDYRNVYQQYWRFGGLSDVHASTTMYCTWDDHEVYNDWNIENVERNNRQPQLAAARQAFFEFRAFRRSTVDADRIWRGFKWGRVVELFILDTRGERRPSMDQYLGRAQMDWLKRALSQSNAVFKLVVTSKPITGRVPLADESMRGEFWEAYRPAREELLGHITNNNIDGVVFLSGDIHTGMLSRVEAVGPYRNLREVCMGPACSGDQSGAIDCSAAGQNEIIVHRFNYTRFHANPTARTLRVEFIGEGGGVICGNTITV